VFLAAFLAASARAEEFTCEVMTVVGEASVAEGDVLKPGATIVTGAGGQVDVAYDRDWSAVTRIEPGSTVTVKSVHPTSLYLASGGVFVDLKDLPKESSFEVVTPTAVAAVRGTEYRTTVAADGATDVFNFSDSPVNVSTAGASSAAGKPVVLYNEQRTGVARTGEKPGPPRSMSSEEFRLGRGVRDRLVKKIGMVRASGRVGKVQDLARVRQELAARPKPKSATPPPAPRSAATAGPVVPKPPAKSVVVTKVFRTADGEGRAKRKEAKKERRKKRHYTVQSSG
jgi:hypothetical protein